MTKKISIKTEEIVNTITHGIGLSLSIAALTLMLVQAGRNGTATSVAGAAIFGASLVLMYTASTLFHGAKKIRLKFKLNKFDHSAVYILIAGTYTPLTLVTLHGAWGWSIFGVIWALAIGGVLFKLIWYKPKYRKISALTYIAMGLVIVVAAYPLFMNISTTGLIWIIIGMAVYALGVIFYLHEDKIPFGHGIWHLFVLGGSFSHFFAVYFHVLPNAI